MPQVIVESIAIAVVILAREAFELGVLRGRLAKHHADVDRSFRRWIDVRLSETYGHSDMRGKCRRITAPVLLVKRMNNEY